MDIQRRSLCKNIVLAILIGAILTGCSSFRGMASFKLSDNIEMEIGRVKTTDRSFEIDVRFKNTTGYPGIAQELDLMDGSLVEYFKTEGIFGLEPVSGIDEHSRRFGSPINYEYRRKMIVYGAKVEGVDYKNGFAQLPKNIDGTVVTKISEKFNENYQKSHKTKGRIVSRSSEEGHWEIVYSVKGIEIITPNGRLSLAGNQIDTTKDK